MDATKEAGEPDHAGEPGGASVWWQWIAPASGPVGIQTCGSGFDTLLGVYTGASVSALNPVASDDDGCGLTSVESSVTFAATAGQIYYIAVDGRAGEVGDIVLRLQQGLRPGRYSGRTSQRKKISFKLSQDLKRITGLKVGLRCQIKGERFPFTLPFRKAIKVRNGGFRKTQRVPGLEYFRIDGQFEGSEFRGTLRYRLSFLVRCDTGNVSWQAAI